MNTTPREPEIVPHGISSSSPTSAVARTCLTLLLAFLPACATQTRFEPGDAIVVCGERISIGAPVVLWTDPGGFNAYVEGPIYDAQGPAGLRYRPGRAWASDPAAIQLADLAQHLDLFVLHYDVCGFSQRCFRLLQDERVLSAHFLLDVDGTLYQTLDLRDEAWHGRFTNARSIGVEMANMGVYPPTRRGSGAACGRPRIAQA